LRDPNNKFGLVIGSGGIKTLAIHFLFEILENYNIKPDVLISCSGGSLLSSLWASGLSISELQQSVDEYRKLVLSESILRKINFLSLLKLSKYNWTENDGPSALLKRDWLLNFFRKQMGTKRLEECDINIFMMATNLETGASVILKEGLLAECSYASCALYPVLPPIRLENKWLVDGGYASATPVFEASKMGCKKIISISFEEVPISDPGNIFEFYMDFVSQIFYKNSQKQNAFAVNYHPDDILFINIYFDKNINLFDVNYVDYIYETTFNALQKKKQEILDFLFLK
jgi:NTE family protein